MYVFTLPSGVKGWLFIHDYYHFNQSLICNSLMFTFIYTLFPQGLRVVNYLIWSVLPLNDHGYTISFMAKCYIWFSSYLRTCKSAWISFFQRGGIAFVESPTYRIEQDLDRSHHNTYQALMECRHWKPNHAVGSYLQCVEMKRLKPGWSYGQITDFLGAATLLSTLDHYIYYQINTQSLNTYFQW